MKSEPRILVTGTNGMVGSYIDFGIKTDRKTLDVTKPEHIKTAIDLHRPDVIIHLAALTDLDYCEKNPDKAYMTNTVGTYNIALASRDRGIKLIYISTAGIFNGTEHVPYKETATGQPQNHYGHSKYAGELIVQSILKDFIIARTCWLFGGGPEKDKKFVAKIISQFDKPEIKALEDNFGSPTFAKDLANAFKSLIDQNSRGTFHLAGTGKCSRYDFAKFIVQTLKPEIPVIPVSGEYFKLEAKRVPNEALASRVNLMRPWKKALKEYLETEWREYVKSKY